LIAIKTRTVMPKDRRFYVGQPQELEGNVRRVSVWDWDWRRDLVTRSNRDERTEIEADPCFHCSSCC